MSKGIYALLMIFFVIVFFFAVFAVSIHLELRDAGSPVQSIAVALLSALGAAWCIAKMATRGRGER